MSSSLKRKSSRTFFQRMDGDPGEAVHDRYIVVELVVKFDFVADKCRTDVDKVIKDDAEEVKYRAVCVIGWYWLKVV